MRSCEEEKREAEYHSKDFDWEEFRSKVEENPSFSHHLISFQIQHCSKPLTDSDAWRLFHTRHSSGKFFKERRYLLKEFPELVSCGESSKVLEIGCGNGSTVLPLLRGNENIIVFACDCSSEILGRAKQILEASNVVALDRRFRSFHCDLPVTGLPSWLACDRFRDPTQQPCLSDFEVNNQKVNDSLAAKQSGCCIGGVDFVTLIFTLSAIPRTEMSVTVKECFLVLKPGGLLLFRDYGLYDMTMLRFKCDQRVGFREYMRSDGTRSYFFCLDTARGLFLDAGFIELELEYCCIKSVNRRNGKSLHRVWVHGKFQKPL